MEVAGVVSCVCAMCAVWIAKRPKKKDGKQRTERMRSSSPERQPVPVPVPGQKQPPAGRPSGQPRCVTASACLFVCYYYTYCSME
jgi:hypothetical protein